MKTNVVVENNVAFTLESYAYGVDETELSVSFPELKKAKVGDRWECYSDSNIVRGVFEEQATVIFKKTNGVAVLFESWGTTEDESAEQWIGEPVLTWFEFSEEGN